MSTSGAALAVGYAPSGSEWINSQQQSCLVPRSMHVYAPCGHSGVKLESPVACQGSSVQFHLCQTVNSEEWDRDGLENSM